MYIKLLAPESEEFYQSDFELFAATIKEKLKSFLSDTTTGKE